LSGSNPQQPSEKEKYQFSTWLIELPPINLYNVDLVYLAFGYDNRYELKKEHTSVYDKERL